MIFAWKISMRHFYFSVSEDRMFFEGYQLENAESACRVQIQSVYVSSTLY